MPRFFINDENLSHIDNNPQDATLTIEGADAQHISKSLRMKTGQALTVCGSSGKEYECEITGFTKETVTLRVLSALSSESEPEYRAVLYQALPKAQKFDTIVQKAVETGVSEIVPIITDRCISRPDAETLSKKIERWQRISLEAAKQCGRANIPKIAEPLTYEEAIDDALGGNVCFLCYEGSGTEALGSIISEGGKNADIRFIVGAEGGFSEKEADYAKQKGLRLANLGKRILRCETAGPFVLGCICYEKELH